MKNIEITPLSSYEEEQLYGHRTKLVGEAFKRDTHYYLQRENDVLHLNMHDNHFNINSLHVGYLNLMNENLVKITYAEFITKIKEIIYNNELNTYWG